MRSSASEIGDAMSVDATIGPWPLMRNNISRSDLDALMRFLSQDDPILTQASNVVKFEQQWSEWLGVKHSVFVNSGSSANLLSIAALRHAFGEGEVIVPTLTWVSDIAAVLHCGLQPIFVDINPRTLGMDVEQVLQKLSSRTRAVFLTHVLGYNAIDQRLLDVLEERRIPLIEDVCESHGATFANRKLGTFGWLSNFSFYYAHHLSTVEGGMICTDDSEAFEMLRMLRSHGMVRECASEVVRRRYVDEHPDLNPDFIFEYPAFNVRSTELNAVIGLNQLPRLDSNNVRRKENLTVFLENLDSRKFRTDFSVEGSCNYAFTLILREPDIALRDRIESALRAEGVEYRRGTSGGGNQLRQPYLKRIFNDEYRNYPNVDHVHFFGFYIGNYPDLPQARVRQLCNFLNSL